MEPTSIIRTSPDIIPLRGVFVDLETSALPPRDGSNRWPGIPQFGAGYSDADGQMHICFMRARIADNAHVDPKALEVNGVTEAQLRDPSLPSVKEALDATLGFIAQAPNKVLYGITPGAFDGLLLEKLCGDHGMKYPFGHRTVDLHSMARGEMERQVAQNPELDTQLNIFTNRKNRKGEPTADVGLSGDDVHTLAGVPLEPSPHRADNGVIWEFESAHRVIHGRQALQQFEDYPVPSYLQRQPAVAVLPADPGLGFGMGHAEPSLVR